MTTRPLPRSLRSPRARTGLAYLPGLVTLAIGAAAVASAGCSAAQGTGEEASNPATTEEALTPPAGTSPVMGLSPSSLAFGSVAIGTSSSKTVTVKNTGHGTLQHIAPGAPSNPDYAVVNGCAGKSLAAGATCTLTVTYKPSDALSEAATVAITSNATNSPAHLALSGSGKGAAWNLSATSFDFGDVGVGTTTAPARMITITNIGSVAITGFAGGGVGAPFNAFQNCAGAPLQPGASCHWFYTFAPTAAGAASASTSISTNVGSASIAVKGNGVGPKMFLSATSLDFGTVGVGLPAAQKVITLVNTGLAPLGGFAGGGIGTPFGAFQNCAGSPLQPGASCQWTYTFAPTAAGPASGTTQISTDGGSATIDVKGVGALGQLTLSATNIDLGSVGVGKTVQHSVLVTNTGAGPITNFAGGGVGGAFNAFQDCAGAPLQPGKSCHWFYTFTPTAAGAQTATTSISTDGGSANITVKATGVASGPVLTASDDVVDFGDVGLGKTAQLPITLTNTGTAPVTSFAGGGIGAPFGAFQNCAGSPLQPGASCTWTYSFAPTAAGAQSGSTLISSDGGSIPITTLGNGVGGKLQVSTNAIDFGDVLLGASAPLATVTLTNTGLAPINNFAGGGLGAPWSAVQSCAGSPLLPGASCIWQYGFAPTVAGFQTGSTLISTDGGSAPIAVTGNGVGGHLAVDVQDIDFGKVKVGQKAANVVVTLTNTGAGAITSFAGGGIGAPWSAFQNCAGKPLLHGQSCQWTYGWSPTAEGLQQGTTEISTDGGSVAITLVGYATP